MKVLNSESMQLRTSEDIVLVRQAVRKSAVALGLRAGGSDQDGHRFERTGAQHARLRRRRDGAARSGRKRPRGTGLRLIFEDQGPGIADIELALTDGYTVRQRHGSGPGRRQALSHEFEISSKPGEGTRVSILRWK